jgi:citrate lyase gamma subunit
MGKTNPDKKTFLIQPSNQELIEELQNEVEQQEGKKITRTAIINVAIAELFNKKQNINTVDYLELKEVLQCYNIL